jgi:hypothetical protein
MKKIVKESLNEMNFQKKMNDPLGALGIGQRKLIEDWLYDMTILQRCKINDDLTIDTTHQIDLENKNLTGFPDFIQFNTANVWFSCANNCLISRGCPRVCLGGFTCSNNQLTSLKGCPHTVTGNFYCQNNPKTFEESYVREICDVGCSIKN